MTLKFITVTVALTASPEWLRQTIETTLSQWGTPLRWAITSVDEPVQMACVEAVVVSPNP